MMEQLISLLHYTTTLTQVSRVVHCVVFERGHEDLSVND